MQLRGVLLGVLNGAVAGLLEVLVALRLLLREHQRRLRLVHLRLVGVDLRLLHVELRIDVLDAGLRGRDLRLRLVERGAIIAVVDPGDHVAGVDMLVVGDGNGGDVAGHFRRQRGLPRGDEGIVGRLKMAGVIDVKIAAAEDSGEQRRADRGNNRAAAQEIFLGLLGLLRLRLFHFDGRCRPLGDRNFSLQGIARGRLRRPGSKVRFAGGRRNRFQALKLRECRLVPFQHTVLQHDLLLSNNRTARYRFFAVK